MSFLIGVEGFVLWWYITVLLRGAPVPLTASKELTLKDCGMKIYWTLPRYCNQAIARDGSCVKSKSSSSSTQVKRVPACEEYLDMPSVGMDGVE